MTRQLVEKGITRQRIKKAIRVDGSGKHDASTGQLNLVNQAIVS
jgi:hypothetical protein